MTSTSGFRALFTEQVQKPEEDIQLDLAALYLAGEEYPSLDISRLTSHLDAFATQVALHVNDKSAPVDVAREIAVHLFTNVGFHGNSEDYYNPDNSYLNRVLETRTGIPITLSLVFLEVGRRLGFNWSGIGLPGHFIVGLGSAGEFLDPFNGGVPMSAEDCRTLVQKMSNGRLQWNDRFLEPLTKLDVIFRMLNNLKAIYMESTALPKAIGVIQRMAIISPGLPSLYQELAWCHAQQHEFRLAIAALETYLKDATDPEDIKRVRGQIEGLQTTLSHLN